MFPHEGQIMVFPSYSDQSGTQNSLLPCTFRYRYHRQPSGYSGPPPQAVVMLGFPVQVICKEMTFPVLTGRGELSWPGGLPLLFPFPEIPWQIAHGLLLLRVVDPVAAFRTGRKRDNLFFGHSTKYLGSYFSPQPQSISSNTAPKGDRSLRRRRTPRPTQRVASHSPFRINFCRCFPSTKRLSGRPSD